MKNLEREFKIRESILLLILAIILIGAVYYYLVHKPVTKTIREAEQKISELSAEKQTLDAQIARLEKMAGKSADPEAVAMGYMPSYNYSEKEIQLLNDILQDTLEYTVTFSGVTRKSNQIRRSFTLRFRVKDYDAVESVIRSLTKTNLRCLIGDLRCSLAKDGSINVETAAVFYETMVGGTEDTALPKDKS
ncbi:MAG: type II secretion system protein GspM [Lachnospiraceae bacterium]|nr:type II secretion system protein GspM [Lachnospiraceae bacterium]